MKQDKYIPTEGVIQYKDLCWEGKRLSTWGLPVFIEHYEKCKKCKKIQPTNTKKDGTK